MRSECVYPFDRTVQQHIIPSVYKPQEVLSLPPEQFVKIDPRQCYVKFAPGVDAQSGIVAFPMVVEYLGRKVRAFDRGLSERARSGSDELFDVLMSAERVVESHERFLGGVLGAIEQLDRHEKETGETYAVVFPLYGSIGFLDALLKRLKPEQFHFARHFFGYTSRASAGVRTKEVSIDDYPPDALQALRVLFVDDVTDRVGSTLAFAKPRLSSWDRYAVNALVQNIHNKLDGGTSFEQLNEEWVSAADYLQKAGVMVASWSSKNKPFTDALSVRSNGNTDMWAVVQKQMIKDGVLLQFGHDKWLVGGRGTLPYPVLDTGASLDTFLPHMPEDLREKLSPEECRPVGCVRIGADVPQLIALNPGAYDKLVKQFAAQL